jgi:hypothetical protein
MSAALVAAPASDMLTRPRQVVANALTAPLLRTTRIGPGMPEHRLGHLAEEQTLHRAEPRADDE